MMKRILAISCLIIAVSIAGAYAGCGTCDKSVVSAAKHNDDFKTLVAAVEAAGLADALSGDDQITVFAPNNDAFSKLPEGAVAELLKPENKNELIKVLTYHVVPGRVKAKDVVKLTSAKTLEGSDIRISVDGGKVKINNAEVIQADIPCKNGVIHVIDAVLLPKA
jgi:uncharacterized surface protein with fasciclin (FAS1) repeats